MSALQGQGVFFSGSARTKVLFLLRFCADKVFILRFLWFNTRGLFLRCCRDIKGFYSGYVGIKNFSLTYFQCLYHRITYQFMENLLQHFIDLNY